MLKFLARVSDTFTDFLVSPPIKRFRWGNLSFLSVLYLAGLLQWYRFLNWGRGPFTFHDWADITLPRLLFLQDAMRTGRLPLHTPFTDTLGGITTRFMAVPDVILSPQILLLRFLDVGDFILFQLAFMYSLGFWGLLLLRKKFNLSMLTFSTLFLLYNFNGHLLAHISVGHFTWSGSFLFIWFALFALELVEGDAGWRWVTKFAILLFIMLLQGSYHQFVWCLLFMLFLAVFSIRNLLAILKGVAFAILLSLARLLPPFILLGKFKDQFIGGYRDSLSIFDCLIQIQAPQNRSSFESFSGGLPTWEATLYIGILGALLLLYFGIFRSAASSKTAHQHQVLILPALCLLVLSLERVFQNLREFIPLPLLTGERISSRMIGLAFAVILVLAALEFQNWLNQTKPSKITLSALLLLLLLEGGDLWQNFVLWSVGRASGAFPVQGFDASMWYVANNLSDIPYLRLIVVGLIVSILSLGFLIFKVWREAHLQVKTSDL